MKLHNIQSRVHRERHRRVGRGPGSGRGKTAGRGTKGQKSRAGSNIPNRFEGGQTPLVQRLPKSGGFRSRSYRHPVVQIDTINKHFAPGDRVSPQTLYAKQLIHSKDFKVKIVGSGKLAHFVRLENMLITKKLAEQLPTVPRSVAKQTSKIKKKTVAKKAVRKK